MREFEPPTEAALRVVMFVLPAKPILLRAAAKRKQR
jgi:hypothetical protein